MARAAHLSFRPTRRPTLGETAADAPAAGAHTAQSAAAGKGRGARSNASGRYEKDQREEVNDGWDLDEDMPPLRTDVTLEKPRKIITFNNSPYVGFDRSINPYRGCEHGCIYCFARPTHAYMGLSPGLDFESKLFAKPSAPKLLEKELSDKNYRPQVIAMGTNTDPYQPIERKFQIMRGILGVFSKFNHPVTILTKSQNITRDLDILGPMAEKNLTRAMVSITTEDKALARSMEPRASAPKWRFEAINKLVDAGVSTGIMTGPMIPGLNDDEMEGIMEKAAELGASFSAFTVLRLPLEVSPLFQEWLETFAPTRAKRIMRHIRDMNGGKDYDPHWSRGREIKTPYAQLIAQRNARTRAKLGFNRERAPLDLSLFRVPAEVSGQMDLFG
ncbi:PA0069 family radical SAM protein [Hyphococcus flavus]|uniref:PA0069 family radical SAM protein n=1 Tax=Hyphococcus flavus TaxID=1866326 RepID=A0AAE9ZGD8_9PROT|nr:PA0069 family radical SAM protein [Hyphococcus flavus]WDI32267.1 PA0069 family radical SAM protein [Hyphococcus flavus]